MKRRFGRGRRRNNGPDTRPPIDAAHWMPRLLEVSGLGAARLEPVEIEGIPDHFAALGWGEDRDGRPLGVGFAPERAADAALAVLALGARRRAEVEGEMKLVAVAPDWSVSDRRRLEVLNPRVPLLALAASELGGGPVEIAPEPALADRPAPEQLASRLARPVDRDAFARAWAALEGLAAKHGGALRSRGDTVELVVMAQRAAALVAEPGAVRIEVFEPERATLALNGGEGLATALDRLEGLLRKILNDRRIRTSEAGLRAALIPLLERAAEARSRALWPLGGPEGEPVDWVGIDADDRCLVAATREHFNITSLAEVLDALALAPGVAAPLARAAGRALSAERPQLVLAAVEFERPAIDALAALGIECRQYDARTRRTGEWSLESRTADAPVFEPVAPSRSGRASGSTAERNGTRDSASATQRDDAGRGRGDAPQRDDDSDRDREGGKDGGERNERGPRRGRGRRGGGRSRRPESAAAAAGGGGSEEAEAGASAPRFEEVSLFDLDDDSNSESREEGGARRRRSRGRRRGRRGRGDAAEGDSGNSERAAGDDSDPEPARATSGGRGRRRPKAESDRSRDRNEERDDDRDEDDDTMLSSDDDDTLVPLADDAPDLDDDSDAFEPDDDDEEDDDDPDAERARRERELRRRARVTRTPEVQSAPRRRAAFVAHADPLSVLTTVVLARDLRLVESFYIYPQDELMTFFRSIATDLGDQTPIYLVGFAAAPPARDTIQSAALYRGRLDWYDHHDWPPEDLVSLRETLGEEHVHIEPGGESSLSSMIGDRTRRSRFSDKLVELVTGRFSQHDYERWGRWWWHHVRELSTQHGDKRTAIEPLLAGRPSDLASMVAKAEEPPLPEELAFVSERDFRIVHFGGLTMVVLDVPEPLDPHLAARIARERYEAHISFTTIPGRELVMLVADDNRTRRGLDLGGMAAHLATKHAWVQALPDADHVARMHVDGLRSREGRLDELITEIAMGRSIVEG